MRIPESFLSAQRAAFQDKPISVFPAVEEKAAGFGTVSWQPDTTPRGNYLVSWLQTVNEIVRNEWGLSSDAVTAFTISDRLIGVVKGDFVRYSGRWYRIVSILRRDSHTAVGCKEEEADWETESHST